MRVRINNAEYSLAENDRIRHGLVQQTSDPIRTVGPVRRQDNIKYTKFNYSSWAQAGVGATRLRRERQDMQGRYEGNNIGAMRDTDAETRFQSAITLPLLNESVSNASSLDHLKAYIQYKANLYGFFEREYAADSDNASWVSSYDASSDTWGDGNEVDGIPQYNGATVGTASGATGTNRTFSHTSSSNSNRLLVVIVTTNDSSSGEYPSGVTYNSVSMTQEATANVGGQRHSLWYLVAPATGANTVSISWSSGNDSGYAAEAADFYNVDQTNPFRASATYTSASDATPSLSLSAAQTDLVYGLCSYVGSNVTIDPGSGQTTTNAESGSPEIEGSYERVGATNDASSAYDHSYSLGGGGSARETIVSAVSIKSGTVGITYGGANEGVRVFDTAVHKGAMYVLGSKGQGAEGQYALFTSTDGTYWTEVAGTGWDTTSYLTTTVTRRNNFEDKLAAVLDNGNQLVVALYEDPDSSGGSTSQVNIGYSTDKGANWTFNAGLVIQASTSPNVSLHKYRDVFDSNSVVVPVLVTSENVYVLDTANNTFEAMLPNGVLSGTAAEAFAADTSSDGTLYVSKEFGDILQINVPAPGQIVIKNIGPLTRQHGNSEDGLVAARQGHANYIYGKNETWLFVAYGGHAAGKNGSILAMDYNTEAWHSLYKDSSANQDTTILVVSSADDGTARLHAVTEGATSDTCFMFEEPLVSPRSGIAQKFKSSGYVEFAEDDFGDPHNQKTIRRGNLDAYDTTADETVVWKYGVGESDEAWSANTVGTFNNTTVSLDPASGVGIALKLIRNRLELNRGGTNTNTPKVGEFELWAAIPLPVLRYWEFAIDIEKTSQETRRDSEQVIADIVTIANNKTSVPFELGKTGAINVEMRIPYTSSVTLTPMGDTYGVGDATGVLAVRVEEVLPAS